MYACSYIHVYTIFYLLPFMPAGSLIYLCLLWHKTGRKTISAIVVVAKQLQHSVQTDAAAYDLSGSGAGFLVAERRLSFQSYVKRPSLAAAGGRI